jgi:hypothetical protein
MDAEALNRPVDVRALCDVRAEDPDAIARAAATRRQPDSLLGRSGRMLVVAADHPARGALGAGPRAAAMADRAELLRRLCAALAHPDVNGVLGTPDILEDLLLLGALDGKVVLGSMNRGGLQGAAFEIDDRFTACTPGSIAALGFQGGKMLLRVDLGDPATARTLEACATAVSGLAERRLLAMVEPFMAARAEGRLRNDLTADAMIRAISIAAGLGSTSAHTWLKVPVVADMARTVAATTLPCVLLGGEVPADPAAAYDAWGEALALPNVRGLVVGRSLLFPADDDVDGAIAAVTGLLGTG